MFDDKLMKGNKPTTTKKLESLSETLASQSGLAVVLVDESSFLSHTNNNSICEVLYGSKEFAPRCAMFCGKAFAEAAAAGKAISRQCHAGLFLPGCAAQNCSE